MVEIYWIIGICAGATFFRGFYSEVLREKKETLFEWGRYRRKQVPPVGISRLIGYDPFGVVRQVSLRAGIEPPELLIVAERSLRALILYHGKEAVIVCGKSFMSKTEEKEFEGVVAHEIGHFVNFEDSLYRFAWYSFAGLLACGTFLFIVFIVLSLSGIFIWGGLLVNLPLVNMPILLSLCAVLLAFACLVVHRVSQKKREFSADKKALFLTRYPWDFVNILSKIASEEDLHTMRKRIEATKRILEKQGVTK